MGEPCGSSVSCKVQSERRESSLFVIFFYAQEHLFFCGVFGVFSQPDINSNRLHITYNWSDSEKMRLLKVQLIVHNNETQQQIKNHKNIDCF